MIKLISLIFIGGGLGSVARFAVARLFAHHLALTPSFPVSTFSVNILGSFLIGLFLGIPSISEKHTWMHFLTVGFCGGFTTFSTFSWENLNLLKQGNITLFLVYAFLSVCLCLLATGVGFFVGKSL